MDGKRCLQKASPQLLPCWMACIKKTDTKEINCPLLSQNSIKMEVFYFIFLMSEDLPETAMAIQIWEMATHCLCDLSEHRCCPCVAGGWRALLSAVYIPNRSPGRFLNKRSLLLSVEMGHSAMAASSPFSTHVCRWPVAASEFFSSFFEESVPPRLSRGEGSGVTGLQGKLLSCLSDCVIAAETSLPATAGLGGFFS